MAVSPSFALKPDGNSGEKSALLHVKGCVCAMRASSDGTIVEVELESAGGGGIVGVVINMSEEEEEEGEEEAGGREMAAAKLSVSTSIPSRQT